MCRFSGCVLRGAANRPSKTGVLDKTGLLGDPQRRSQEQRGSGAGEAALNIHTQTHTYNTLTHGQTHRDHQKLAKTHYAALIYTER